MKARIWWISSTIVVTLIIILSIMIFNPSILKNGEKVYRFSGNGNNTLDTPMAVVSEGNRVYVANGNKNQISVFNPKGKLLYQFGKQGRNNGEFLYPVDLLFHQNGKLYVADFNNSRIQVFTPKGTFILTFGQELNMKPAAITADSRGFLFVSDIQTHTIKVFSEEGKFLFEFGGYGEQPGFFNYANGLSMSTNGEELYISDSQNARIQVFTKDGQFIKVLQNDISLGLPRGIHVSENKIYVADTLLHKVFVLNLEGKILETIGEKEELFKFPTDVYLSKKQLYVVDRMTNSILVIKRGDDHE